MSQIIVLMAVFDDCLNIMLRSGAISQPIESALGGAKRFAQQGGSFIGGDLDMHVRLLGEYRAAWEARSPEDELEKKLAYVAGWLVDRGPRKFMEKALADCGEEASLVQDAFLFREHYANPCEKPLIPLSSLKPKEVREFFDIVVKRMMIELHTLIPGRENIEEWLANLWGLHEGYQSSADRYAETVADLDSMSVEKHIYRSQFYSYEDLILATAREARCGDGMDPQKIRSALEPEPSSHYAKAVRIGCRRLMAVSDFFSGQLNDHELLDKLARHVG
jgi:hypothetical protein